MQIFSQVNRNEAYLIMGVIYKEVLFYGHKNYGQHVQDSHRIFICIPQTSSQNFD